MGVILAWISGISGLAIIVISYSIFMPMLNFMIKVTTDLGAPAGPALFLAKCMMWGFILLGITCIAYPFIYSYKQEPDQGLQGFR